MKNKSAFTLIELLVVVAIIAMVIALAVPAFTAAKKRSRAKQNTEQVDRPGAYRPDHDYSRD